jgi:hypothetical protein
MVEVSVALKDIWMPASSYSTGFCTMVELLSEIIISMLRFAHVSGLRYNHNIVICASI